MVGKATCYATLVACIKEALAYLGSRNADRLKLLVGMLALLPCTTIILVTNCGTYPCYHSARLGGMLLSLQHFALA